MATANVKTSKLPASPYQSAPHDIDKGEPLFFIYLVHMHI